MSKDICMDCGMILPANQKICTVCGFDNGHQDREASSFTEYPTDFPEDVAPENYPGF